MTAWGETLLALLTVSVVPLIGMIVVTYRPSALGDLLPRLVPLAIGALAGAAVLHLVPEAMALTGAPGRVLLLVLAGFLGFLAVDRLMHGRLGGSGPGSGGTTGASGDVGTDRARQMVPLTLAGDALHNVVDGILMASAFLDAPSLGILTGAAIAVHEVPRELGTFALLVRGGMRPSRAIAFNVGTAVAAAGAAVVTLVVGTRVAATASHLLPVAAGTFLYLAGTIAVAEFRGPVRSRQALAKGALALLGFALAAFGSHQWQGP